MNQNQKKIISTFKKSGATDRKSSKSFKVLNLEKGEDMKELIQKRILVATGADRYYLNTYQFDRKKKERIKWAQGIIGIALVIVIIFLLRM